jgi:hypothetical protein
LGHKYLFDDSPSLRKELIRLLKSLGANPTRKFLELRSFRRGALQTMGTSNVDLEEIRMFSRHADPRTLHRYLAWGKYATANHIKTIKAASNLWPSPKH